MPKPILIRPDNELQKQLKDAAKTEQRKMGPTVVLLLKRYFADRAIAQAAPDAPKVES